MNSRTLGAAIAALLLLTLTQCRSDPLVVIGPPNERHDHNRDREIRTWSYRMAGDKTVRLAPLGRNAALGIPPPPRVPRGGARGPDGLYQARLLPVHSGLPLPLSHEGAGETYSDREDLLDYLATGPYESAGLEAPETQGGLLAETARRFEPALALLEADLDRRRLEAWADETGAELSFRIADPRLDMRAFESRVAFAWSGFWFVVFQPHDADRYTRLVVTPEAPTRQDFEGKKPTRDTP